MIGSRLSSGCALLSCAVLAPCLAAVPPAAQPREPLAGPDDLWTGAALRVSPVPVFPYPQRLDQTLAELRRASWVVYSISAKPDARGRTPVQDVDEWLMTPEHEKRLKELQAKAWASANKGLYKDMQSALHDAAPLCWREAYMADALHAYWRLQALIGRHATNLSTLEVSDTPEGRAPRQARFAEANARVSEALTQVMSAGAPETAAPAMQELHDAGESLIALYNRERSTLAQELSDRQHALGSKAEPQARATPCPAAADRTSGTERPSLGLWNPAPSSFYPTASRRDVFEGMTVLEVWISATGCMQKVAVYDSSGVAELDAAAISWAEQASFYPAERNHKGVDGTTQFGVRFTLHP